MNIEVSPKMEDEAKFPKSKPRQPCGVDSQFFSNRIWLASAYIIPTQLLICSLSRIGKMDILAAHLLIKKHQLMNKIGPTVDGRNPANQLIW